MKKGLITAGMISLAGFSMFFFTGAGSRDRDTANIPMIICFGDDITAGVGAGGPYIEDPDRSYPAILSTKMQIPVVNAGVRGDTTTSALLRLNRDVLSKKPQVVIINLGLVDLFENIDLWLTEYNYDVILSNLTDGNRKIYVTNYFSDEMISTLLSSMNWSDDEKYEFRIQYASLFQSLMERYDIEIVQAVWNGVWGLHMSGDVHPDATGYKIMATNYLAVLKPYLSSRNFYKE